MDEQNLITYCAICGKPKEFPDKPLCLNCFDIKNNIRRCAKCKRILSKSTPSNYSYCEECFKKIYYKK